MINKPIYHSTNTQKSANQCDAESIGKPRYDGTTGCPRKTSGKEKTSCKSLRRWFSSECFFTSKTHCHIFLIRFIDTGALFTSGMQGTNCPGKRSRNTSTNASKFGRWKLAKQWFQHFSHGLNHPWTLWHSCERSRRRVWFCGWTSLMLGLSGHETWVFPPAYHWSNCIPAQQQRLRDSSRQPCIGWKAKEDLSLVVQTTEPRYLGVACCSCCTKACKTTLN